MLEPSDEVDRLPTMVGSKSPAEPEEAEAAMAGRAVGILCSLEMLAMSAWWGYRLIGHPTSTGAIALLPAVLAVVIGMAFLGGSRVAVLATLFFASPVLLYLLWGEGPSKWAGYGYLGAWVAAVALWSSKRAS